MPNILLIGAGKMGGAMLRSWTQDSNNNITVLDPGETEAIKAAVQAGATHITQSSDIPTDIQIAVLAIKPQLFKKIMPDIAPHIPTEALIISVLAGTSLSSLEAGFPKNPIIRAMPNTPASIGKGITAVTGNKNSTKAHLNTAIQLLSPCGPVRPVKNEDLIDAVTAISGSGPAYVFYLVEALAASGMKLGLTPEDAQAFAKHMVVGAGALLESSEEDPSQLRRNVTSPNGTTQAALDVLMDEAGLAQLMHKTTRAAYSRAQALAKE